MLNRLNEILDDCISAAYEAGEAILKIYNEGFHVQEKADHTPVTEADIKANQIILERLMNKYPEVAYLAEESADDLSRLEKDWCFIIDPLDGTKEFIKRSNEFTVNIALVNDQRPVLGVVYIPALREVYYAVKGKGAFKKEINK
ncbi:MAG: 3'(2'),5'-bisphosphate nucleotidase CysQ, partial [Firmicutes bacterium]|nr:3'(2'),5'-bisphosphate nucleotidase CysQ [Bacillota bacterium]